MSLKLNPLSTSKGKKFLCEMCGKPATLACQHCRVTYYCTQEHQSVDWFGIHEKICQLLGALRTLRPTLGSEDERQRRNLTVQMSQHALIDLCKNEAQKHLVQGQYELAIPGALQSLRFSMEVYGAGRIELVPAYLLLAESNLGLKRYKVAEEFLLYANWSVLKNPDCSNELKSQLCRNFGKLYASQGRFDAALKQLANDVYYSSLESGPEHIDTAGGYFYMADVFLTKGEVENALAFYDKVVDIWYKFLVNLRHRPDENISDYLSEAHIGEAVEMLRAIVETRKKHRGPSHLATGEGAYTLGILRHITGYTTEARRLYKQALAVYEKHLGADNESTAAIVRAIEELPPGTDGKEEDDAAPGDSKGSPEQHQRHGSASAGAGAGAGAVLALPKPETPSAGAGAGPASAGAGAESAGESKRPQSRSSLKSGSKQGVSVESALQAIDAFNKEVGGGSTGAEAGAAGAAAASGEQKADGGAAAAAASAAPVSGAAATTGTVKSALSKRPAPKASKSKLSVGTTTRKAAGAAAGSGDKEKAESKLVLPPVRAASPKSGGVKPAAGAAAAAVAGKR